MKRGFTERVLEYERQKRKRRWQTVWAAGWRLTLLAGIITMQVEGCRFAEMNRVNAAALAQAEKAKVQPDWAQFKVTMDNDRTWVTMGRDQTTGVPLSVLVNGERWSLVRVASINKDPKTVSGETFCGHRTIVYLYHESRTELKTALLHEIFHAADCAHGGDTWWNSENDDKHVGIYRISEFLTEFAGANPEFMNWWIFGN